MVKILRTLGPALALVVTACSGGSPGMTAPPATSPARATSSPSSQASPTPTSTATPLPGATTTPTPGPTGETHAASVAGCRVFPPDNPWNTDISSAPVDPNSAAYLAHMNAGTSFLHPDFGSDPTSGIPYIAVGATQAPVPVTFDYANESDPGPYPIPANAPIEGGTASTGDRHVIVVDASTCKLYEMYAARYIGPGWHAGSGAVFDLASDALRPDTWTSADAAGLPILAGLVRYDEATQTHEIDHAMRFTIRRTQRAFVHPATHAASSSTDPADPPMGLRVRLKASYDLSRFTGASRAVLVALKRFGMFVADNGSD